MRALHDERAHIDYSADGLIAHELAHQWFGDLLTCNDWAHIWLNEGFASYFEALWAEQNLGAEEFSYNMRKLHSYGPSLIVLATALAVLLGGPLAVQRLTEANTKARIIQASRSLAENGVLEELNQAYRDIATLVEPSVVHISTEQTSQDRWHQQREDQPGRDERGEPDDLGERDAQPQRGTAVDIRVQRDARADETADQRPGQGPAGDEASLRQRPRQPRARRARRNGRQRGRLGGRFHGAVPGGAGTSW